MSRTLLLAEETPFYQAVMDPQEQREADLLAVGEDDALDPDFADWCVPARLKREFGNSDLGVDYLLKNDPLLCVDSDLEIEAQLKMLLKNGIYQSASQEENSRDKFMMDVPRDGRRKGGTHSVAPENRKRRGSKKVVNIQLLRWNCDEAENAEAEAERIAINAKIAQKADYILSIYKGKYKPVLELKLQGKSTQEIARITGKTERRVRQIVNGNFSAGRKAKPGLLQFITAALANLPDLQTPTIPVLVYSAPVPVMVQPVHCKKKSLQKQAPVAQLAWDFDALMGVAA